MYDGVGHLAQLGPGIVWVSSGEFGQCGGVQPGDQGVDRSLDESFACGGADLVVEHADRFRQPSTGGIRLHGGQPTRRLLPGLPDFP